MDVKLFALCNQEAESADAGQKAIMTCIQKFCPECDEISQFSSQRRMLLAISQSLRAADVVVVAVQGSMYNATKKLLCAALDIKISVNELVDSELSKHFANGKIKEAAYKNNVLFPTDAVIFPTKNMINCGFAISSNGQYIIYIPIDEPKVSEVVLGSLYDYLAEITDLSSPGEALEQRHRDVIRRTSEKLINQSVKVAVAVGDGSDIIDEYSDKRLKACFIFDEHFESRKDEDIKEYTVNVARRVRDNCHTQLGAAISQPVYDNNGDFYEFVAVADVNGTKTLKIYGESGESAEELTMISVEQLMLTLYDYNDFGVEESEDESSPVEQAKDSTLKNVLSIGAASLVLAASVAGFIIALIIK